MAQFSKHSIQFLLSAAKISQLPPDQGYEVAVVGRSNSGKSSAINALTRQKGLARTSKTPGRTQLINFFEIDDERRLVDLPGYGYAKVDESVRRHWERLLSDYMNQRECLRGLVVTMDVRHPLKPLDEVLLEWSWEQQLPTLILLTKADKLKRGAASKSLQEVKQALAEYKSLFSVQLFSSTRAIGHAEAGALLDEWFGFE